MATQPVPPSSLNLPAAATTSSSSSFSSSSCPDSRLHGDLASSAAETSERNQTLTPPPSFLKFQVHAQIVMQFFACCTNRMQERPTRDLNEDYEHAAGASSQDVGLGIAFKPDKQGHLEVKRLVKGGPAEKSNLIKLGDVLHAVDGENVLGRSRMEVVNLLKGPQGSKVRLKILRPETNGKKTFFGEIK
eukprot:751519-Hanusia_phi.AAC.2